MDVNIQEIANVESPQEQVVETVSEPMNELNNKTNEIENTEEKMEKQGGEENEVFDERIHFLNDEFRYKISNKFLQNSDLFSEQQEIKFQRQIPTEFLCSCCHLLTWMPLSLGCGHTICEGCQLVTDNNRSCPIDQQLYEPSELSTNELLQGKIAESLIHCIDGECHWIGKLVELGEHFRTCSCRKVECPNCNDILKIASLDDHVINLCLNRSVACQYCQASVLYTHLDDHHQKCYDKPVSCPNECKDQTEQKVVSILKQGELEDHLTNNCLDRKTLCQFENFKCTKTIKFRKLNIHMVKNALVHLDGLCSSSQQSRDLLEAQILSMIKLKEKIIVNSTKINNLKLRCGSQLLWKIVDVQEKYEAAVKSKSNELLSSAFYSSIPYGYKLTMKIMLNGSSAVSSGRYVSVFISICDNHFNNLLTWPFQQKVTVHLINQVTSNHASYTIIPNPIKENLDYLNRPTVEKNPFFGIDKFVPCSAITGETEYVVGNVMYVKVNVEPYSVV